MQEMGDVGDEGDVVDEQLWGDDKDKPEQSKAEEKYEKDAPVQVSHDDCGILCVLHDCLALPCMHNKAQVSREIGCLYLLQADLVAVMRKHGIQSKQ